MTKKNRTEAEIDEVLWRELEPLLPPAKARRFPRAALGGILFVLRSGIGWARLPWSLGFGSGMSCWRRLRQWQEAGVWERRCSPGCVRPTRSTGAGLWRTPPACAP